MINDNIIIIRLGSIHITIAAGLKKVITNDVQRRVVLAIRKYSLKVVIEDKVILWANKPSR